MKSKKIIFAVYDTLEHEYRGYKAAGSFEKNGWESETLGVRFDNNVLKAWQPYSCQRIRLISKFPMILNLLIFWTVLLIRLISSRAEIIYCHDIFPLLPVYIASKLKRIPYIYDAHEFWHGNSQVEGRSLKKFFWTTYEKIFIRQAKNVITVSASIARELEKIYGLEKVRVFTNLPLRKELPSDNTLLHRHLGLQSSERVILYQGHFLVNNGLDTVINAFSKVKEKAVLVLIGSGSEKEDLIELSKKLEISEKVFFTGPFPHSELINYTVCADIGLCLIKNFGKSYYYSTPNKMFEFIQAGVPQICSDFPEMSAVVKGYGAGETVDPEDPEEIAKVIGELLTDRDKYESCRSNSKTAGRKLVWESIEDEFVSIAD